MLTYAHTYIHIHLLHTHKHTPELVCYRLIIYGNVIMCEPRVQYDDKVVFAIIWSRLILS